MSMQHGLLHTARQEYSLESTLRSDNRLSQCRYGSIWIIGYSVLDPVQGPAHTLINDCSRVSHVVFKCHAPCSHARYQFPVGYVLLPRSSRTLPDSTQAKDPRGLNHPLPIKHSSSQGLTTHVTMKSDSRKLSRVAPSPLTSRTWISCRCLPFSGSGTPNVPTPITV
jgi:hypothetical protein